MSIVVNEKTKNNILQYIEDNAIESDFTPSFFREALYSLKNYNQLNEDLAEHILEGLYEKSRVIRDLRTPTDEFKDRFDVVFEKFDKIPKPDEWGTFRNVEFSNIEIAEDLQDCFELVELDEQFDIAMDARKMAEEAINSITYLDKNNITIPEKMKIQMGEISDKLQELLKLKVTDVVSLQKCINQYNENATQIWQDYLEEPNHNLIHNFTSGAIKGEFRDKYMSTSLITDNAMGTYGKSGYGFIIKPKHIVAADSKDTYTINNSSNDKRVTIIKKPIKLPQQIETEMMQTCKEVNGEILNSDKSSIYSEAIVDEFEIIGSYVITNGEKELNQHYTEAIKLAEERGVEFKEFDISEERAKKGLSPLSDGMKKDLCRKILYSYAFDEKYGIPQGNYGNYASSFIDIHYQEFAERFLTVKEREGYTAEDIEKEFRKMILDDAIKTKDGIHIFDKESITYYQGFFLGKVTEDEFKYIVSNRYDFNNCKTLEEFKQRFAEFNGTVLQSKYFDEAQEYLDELFLGREYLEGMDITDEEFEQIFNSNDRSFDKIVRYVKQREEEKQETIEQLANEQSTDRAITQEEKASIEIEDQEYEQQMQEIIEQLTNEQSIDIDKTITQEEKVNIEIEDQEYEKQIKATEEENIPFMKKLARKLASNNFLRKLPFVNKFIEKQLDLLPEANEQIKNDNSPKLKRDALIEDLSNNGKFLNLAEKNPNRIVQTLRDRNNNPDLSNGIDFDVTAETNGSEERI